MRFRSHILAATAVAALALAPAAAGHVTLQPEEAPAGGFTRLDVRVPNERDNAGTTKVVVQFPPGFLSVSSEPVPGWEIETTMRELDEPVEQFGEQVTEEVGRITFTGVGETGVIRPGEFQDFGLSVGVPDGRPGSKLTFKALQTYSNGEVVRWIGPPDADEPAPQVTLTAAEGEPEPAAQQAPPATEEDDDEGGSDALSIIALVVAAAALAAGLTALMGRRRERVS